MEETLQKIQKKVEEKTKALVEKAKKFAESKIQKAKEEKFIGIDPSHIILLILSLLIVKFFLIELIKNAALGFIAGILGVIFAEWLNPNVPFFRDYAFLYAAVIALIASASSGPNLYTTLLGGFMLPIAIAIITGPEEE